jgi:hypothetical protein
MEDGSPAAVHSLKVTTDIRPKCNCEEDRQGSHVMHVLNAWTRHELDAPR